MRLVKKRKSCLSCLVMSFCHSLFVSLTVGDWHFDEPCCRSKCGPWWTCDGPVDPGQNLSVVRWWIKIWPLMELAMSQFAPWLLFQLLSSADQQRHQERQRPLIMSSGMVTRYFIAKPNSGSTRSSSTLLSWTPIMVTSNQHQSCCHWPDFAYHPKYHHLCQWNAVKETLAAMEVVVLLFHFFSLKTT